VCCTVLSSVSDTDVNGIVLICWVISINELIVGFSTFCSIGSIVSVLRSTGERWSGSDVVRISETLSIGKHLLSSCFFVSSEIISCLKIWVRSVWVSVDGRSVISGMVRIWRTFSSNESAIKWESNEFKNDCRSWSIFVRELFSSLINDRVNSSLLTADGVGISIVSSW